MSTVASMPVPAPEGSPYKRKRSASRSPPRSSSPPRTRVKLDVQIEDVDPVRRRERERQLALRLAEQELEKEKEKEKENGGDKALSKFDAAAEFAKLTASKSGGVYVPPARLRAMQAAAAAQDKASPEFQRMSWDALRKSLTGIVNRVNTQNIKHVVPELFAENLIRGKGLFARSVMKAQAASLPYTPVFAALVAIINTKLPQVGELLLHRLISQFRRSFKRNDKILCLSTTTFIAHLVNQGVAHEIIALQILVLLLERPTDDSVEIAVGFMREVGAFLAENAPKMNNHVYESFRTVLNEGQISQRVQFMVEVLMQVRKDKYKDNPIIPEGLDLVPEEDQITHQVSLEDELQIQEGSNIFKFDPNFLENEEKYRQIKAEILGEDESSDEESGSEEESESDEEQPVEDKPGIEDQTGTNLVNLRRTIYLTIMNSLNFEEAVHKLLKIKIEEGEEIEMCKMIIECCSQERSYSTFYGLIGERFSKLNRAYTAAFEETFREYYQTIHRYETNRLRNISRFFGHLLASDSISWAVLDVVKMNEDDTTSSSRIFVKILCQEMMEEMGLKGLVERFKDPEIRNLCKDMFPLDNPKNTRFSINYFTSIGLGAVTEEMREHLKNAPRLIMEQRRALLAESSSSDSDSDLSDSDSDTDSDTESDSDTVSTRSRSPRRRRRSSTPPRTRRRTPPSSSRSRSRTPPPRRRSPPPRDRKDGDGHASRRRDDSRERYKDRRPDRDDTPPRRGRDDTPPRRAPRDDIPPRRAPRDDSPPRRPPRDESPPPRRMPRDDSPPRRVSRDDPPPRRVSRDDSPPRRGGRDLSPPPKRGRDDTPPRRRDSPDYRRDRSPPSRRDRREDSPPRRRYDSPPGRGRDESPPPRRNGRGREGSRERYERRR